MARDSAATRARILAAAVEEFAEHGFAGGRIDRIADLAEANKRSIYVYYGDKEQLFNAALNQALCELMETVPLTEDDLPGYAGRIFDYGLEHPQVLRLSAWRQLERPAMGPDDAEIYVKKVGAMGKRNDSTASGIGAADLIILINGLAWAWVNSPEALRSADGSDPESPERRAEHRAALVESARRLVAVTRADCNT